MSLVSTAILIASVSPSISPVLARAQHVSQGSTSPDEVVRKFYDWYLHAGLPSPERKNLATFQKYSTRRLLKRQMDPQVDSDGLVDAQDFDETWKDDFSVSKATIRGEQSTVLVKLKGKNFSYQLRVTLRRETGLWKIDNVKGSDWKNP
jgi:hypothetical protein